MDKHQFARQISACRLQRYNKFLKIVTIYNKISQKSSYIASFQHLYVESFPDCERRDWGQVIGIMETDNRFHVVVARVDKGVQGFVSYWLFDGFSYIEHLAVKTTCRHRGIGGGLVNYVESMGAPLVLEVERPVDDATRRRVAFYEHLGLVLHDEIDYVQPPYSPDKCPVPMCLMTSQAMQVQDVRRAIDVIKREVYGVES